MACAIQAMLTVVFCQPAASQADTDMLRTIHDAFVSNRASFTHAKVRFAYVQGNAGTAEEARAGKFDPRYEAACSYAFDARQARYERTFPEDQLRQSSHFVGDQVTSIIHTYRMVTDGDQTLFHSLTPLAKGGMAQGLKLTPGRRAFDVDFRFPLSLGSPEHGALDNLGFHLAAALRGDKEILVQELERDAEFDGRKVVKLTLRMKLGTVEYWIDQERGAVPLQVVSQKLADDDRPGWTSSVFSDDLQQVPGHGWLPFRQSWWYSIDDTGGQIIITDADFDKAPRRDDLSLEFSEPRAIVDSAKGLRYPPRRIWNLAELPSASGRGVEKVEYVSLPTDAPPTLPGERVANPRRRLGQLGAAILVLTVALAIWFRRRAHGS